MTKGNHTVHMKQKVKSNEVELMTKRAMTKYVGKQKAKRIAAAQNEQSEHPDLTQHLVKFLQETKL